MKHDLCSKQRWIRTKVLRSVPNDISCLKYSGKILVLDNDGRVGFVVFKQYIIPWMILFDQIILKQECIFFRIYDNIFNFPDVLYKYPRLIIVVLFVKVRINASFQVLRFSDIYNCSLFIVVLITSRFFGKYCQ